MESKANPTNDLLIALGLLLIPLLIKLQPIAEKTNAVIEGKSYSALPYIVVIVPSTIFLVMMVLGVRAFFRTNEIKTDVSLKDLEEDDDIMGGYAL